MPPSLKVNLYRRKNEEESAALLFCYEYVEANGEYGKGTNSAN